MTWWRKTLLLTRWNPVTGPTLYEVEAVRDDDGKWNGRVSNLPEAISWATSLAELDEHMREAVAVVLDLPEGAEHGLHMIYVYPDLPSSIARRFKLVQRGGRRRSGRRGGLFGRAREYNSWWAADQRLVVKGLRQRGYAMGDIAFMLNLTIASVNQAVSDVS